MNSESDPLSPRRLTLAEERKIIVAFLLEPLVARGAHRQQIVGLIRTIRRTESSERDDMVNVQLPPQIFFADSTRSTAKRVSLADVASNRLPVPASEFTPAFQPDFGTVIVTPETPAPVAAEVKLEPLLLEPARYGRPFATVRTLDTDGVGLGDRGSGPEIECNLIVEWMPPRAPLIGQSGLLDSGRRDVRLVRKRGLRQRLNCHEAMFLA